MRLNDSEIFFAAVSSQAVSCTVFVFLLSRLSSLIEGPVVPLPETTMTGSLFSTLAKWQ